MSGVLFVTNFFYRIQISRNDGLDYDDASFTETVDPYCSSIAHELNDWANVLSLGLIEGEDGRGHRLRHRDKERGD